MDMLSAVLSAISGVLIFCIQAIVIDLVSGEQIIKTRIWLSILITATFDFVAELCFDLFPSSVNFIFMLVNEFKSCVLIGFAKGRFKISDSLITIIIREFCTVICSIIYNALPEKIHKLRHIRETTQGIVVVTILIVIIIWFIRKRKQSAAFENISLLIPNRVFALVCFSLFVESGITEILSLDQSNSSDKIRFVKILLFILTVINAIIIVTLIVSVVSQKYYDNMNRLLKSQVDSQLRHYEKREKLNAEIREFRHDFNNHILCLESMMATGKYSEANAYLQNLSGMMPSGDFLFRTGNYIADAILTEIQETNKNITVEFKGMIPQNVDNSDLCIILSNAMNNAAEASRILPGTNTITVYGNCQQGVFVLIINNPTTQRGNFTDILPNTTKSDKESHGFGLSNIRRIVKKYNGTMHTLLKDGTFTLSLTLAVEQPIHTS